MIFQLQGKRTQRTCCDLQLIERSKLNINACQRSRSKLIQGYPISLIVPIVQTGKPDAIREWISLALIKPGKDVSIFVSIHPTVVIYTRVLLVGDVGSNLFQ